MKTCKKGLHQYADELKSCPECKKATEKAWFDNPEHKDQRKDYQKNYQKTYRQSPKGKAYNKAYETTPQRKAIKTQAHGKRTKVAANGDLTANQILERIEEFDNKCAYCSVDLLIDGKSNHPHYQNIEHIVALLNGGEHTKSNIIPACRGCNNSKCNKDVWQWMKEQGIEPSEKLLAILLVATKKREAA